MLWVATAAQRGVSAAGELRTHAHVRVHALRAALRRTVQRCRTLGGERALFLALRGARVPLRFFSVASSAPTTCATTGSVAALSARPAARSLAGCAPSRLGLTPSPAARTQPALPLAGTPRAGATRLGHPCGAAPIILTRSI